MIADLDVCREDSRWAVIALAINATIIKGLSIIFSANASKDCSFSLDSAFVSDSDNNSRVAMKCCATPDIYVVIIMCMGGVIRAWHTTYHLINTLVSDWISVLLIFSKFW